MLIALDALRAASLLLTLEALDGDDCEFHNCKARDRLTEDVRHKIDAAIVALELIPAAGQAPTVFGS